jgi:hypothetical protein
VLAAAHGRACSTEECVVPVRRPHQETLTSAPAVRANSGQQACSDVLPVAVAMFVARAGAVRYKPEGRRFDIR